MSGYVTTGKAPAKPRGSAAKRRRVSGSFGSYADAKRINDRLSESRFADERSMIIARDLSVVEHSGRGRAAFSWAARGAAVGALIALLFGALAYGASRSLVGARSQA
jgi:hypothetical protein